MVMFCDTFFVLVIDIVFGSEKVHFLFHHSPE